MTVIDYTPIKKIIIHEIEYIDYEEFIEVNANNVCGWIDGIIYGVTHFPQSPEIVLERRDGLVRWALIQYAFMDDYKPQIKTQNNLSVMVINKTGSPPLSDAIAFIQEFHKKVVES